MTCSQAMRRTGPASAGRSWIFFDISGLSFSAERVTEMAFATYESFPARMPRLFDDGSHEKTSAVMHCLYSSRTYFTASLAFYELSDGLPCASCNEPPYAQRMERMAMLVPSSCERPMPTGLPCLSLIRLPPTRRSCHESGPFGKPTAAQRAWREVPGAGA